MSLHDLKLKYFPSVLGFENLAGYGIILEKRIQGDDIQKVWSKLQLKNKTKIISKTREINIQYLLVREWSMA